MSNPLEQQPVARDQYGREIKEGVVFGYLCLGLGGGAHNNFVYRFGRTCKTQLPTDYPSPDQTKMFVDRLEPKAASEAKPLWWGVASRG